MDTHDHKKTHPSGHEHHAVHLCHKCGWPFPNPHPSAKHRRAHKRVCGTLEGYKVVDSEVKPHSNPSDDERDHSDEDRKRPDIPSLNVLDRSEKDQGSGESGKRSNQSEEEVFADAPASFSENTGEFSSGVETLLKSDLNPVKVIEASATDQTIRSHTSDSGTEEHHGEETSTHGLADNPAPMDHMDHISNSTSTLTMENVYGTISSDLPIVKSESPLDDKPKPFMDESAEVAIAANPLQENVPCEADVKVIEENNQDGDISSSAVLQREDLRTPNESHKLGETEKLHAISVPSDEVVLSSKCPLDMLIPEKKSEDFSETAPLGQMSPPGETAQIKVGSMHQLESANSADFVDASDAQLQENENFHVLSIPGDLPIMEQPEDLIRGFKDHKVMKSHHEDDSLVRLETMALQGRPDTSKTGHDSNVESKIREENSQISLESPLLPDALKLKGENDEPLDREGPIEEEKSSAQANAASDIGQIKPDADQRLQDEKVEDNKNFHVLHLPHDLPLVEQPENMIKDFKDHKGKKMDQFDFVASCETTVQAGKGNLVDSFDCSSSQSKTPKEDAEAGVDILEITAKPEEPIRPLDKDVPIEQEEFSGDKNDPKLKLDPSEGQDLSNLSNSMNDSNGNKGKNKDFHVYSVPDDVVVVDKAENTIKDFKDHKEMEGQQLDNLASSGTASQRENSDLPVGEGCLAFKPKMEMECIELSPLSMHDRQCTSKSEDWSCKPINSEVRVGGKDLPHSLHSVDAILESNKEVPQESSTEKVEKNNVVETRETEELKHIITSSQTLETPESASKMLADASPEVVDMLTEVCQSISGDIGINEEAKTNTYSSKAGDHRRSAVDESYLVSGTATESTENPNDGQVNMTNKSIADESVCGSEEQTGNKTESKDNDLLKEETVLILEVTTHEAQEVRVISVDNSAAHLGSQDELLAAEEGIEEDEKDRSARGEKSCILGGVADAEKIASATEEFHANAIESGGAPTEHSITLPEEKNTANQQHPTSAYIASTEDDTNEMVSEDGATKLTLTTSDTMPSILRNTAAGDQGGNGIRRKVPGPDSLMQEESDATAKQGDGESALNAALDSSGSLEAHWGSVSVLSTQSDTPAVGEAEALPSSDSQVASEPGKSHENSGKAEPEVKHIDKSDVFELPSFMTLVEPGGSKDQNAVASVQKQEHVKSPSVQAGWLPSLPHVSNDSQGRKKNEEIIAKVTNWSAGKQHSPFKNLLVEANRDNKLSPTSPRENPTSGTLKEEYVMKDKGSGVTTVGSILGDNALHSGAAKKQVGQEWNSPARYPDNIKREKRKVKGRPYWVQFVCCASAN